MVWFVKLKCYSQALIFKSLGGLGILFYSISIFFYGLSARFSKKYWPEVSARVDEIIKAKGEAEEINRIVLFPPNLDQN